MMMNESWGGCLNILVVLCKIKFVFFLKLDFVTVKYFPVVCVYVASRHFIILFIFLYISCVYSCSDQEKIILKRQMYILIELKSNSQTQTTVSFILCILNNSLSKLMYF